MPRLFSIPTTHDVRRILWTYLGLIGLFLHSGFGLTTAHAQASLPISNEPGATIIWGITSYTRWPSADAAQSFGTPRPLHICTIGDDATARALTESAHEPVAHAHNLPGLDAAPAYIAASVRAQGCHVLYQAAPPAKDAAAALPHTSGLLQELTGANILMIGRFPDFCSVGGMFCLHPDSSGFVANISAISRSPLRINPQVLQLGKKPKGQ